MPRRPTATPESVEAAVHQLRQSGLPVEYNFNGTVLNLGRVRQITGGATKRVRALILQILAREHPGQIPRAVLDDAVRLVLPKTVSGNRGRRRMDPGDDGDIIVDLKSELHPLLHEIRALVGAITALNEILARVHGPADPLDLPMPQTSSIISGRDDQHNAMLAVGSNLLRSSQDLENETGKLGAVSAEQQSHAENRKIAMPLQAIDDLRNRMPPPVRRRGEVNEPPNNEQHQR